jgi:hypothetical protein
MSSEDTALRNALAEAIDDLLDDVRTMKSVHDVADAVLAHLRDAGYTVVGPASKAVLREQMTADLDAWVEAEFEKDPGPLVPDFWDECNTSDNVAEWLVGKGWVRKSQARCG